MLPYWLILDRLDRELRALRSLERDTESRAGPMRRRELSRPHQAVVAAARAVADAGNDVEGQAACVAWRSLAQARDVLGGRCEGWNGAIGIASRGVASGTGPRQA